VSFIRLSRHYVSVPFFLLGAFEVLLLILSVYLAAWVRSVLHLSLQMPEGVNALIGLFPQALVFAVPMLISMVAMGLYQARLREGLTGMILRLGLGLLFGAMALKIVFYWFPEMYVGRGVLTIAIVVAFLVIGVTRFFFHRFIDENQLKRRVLVLGAGEKAASISRFLRRRSDRRGFEIVSYLRYGRSRVAADIKRDLVVEHDRPIVDIALGLKADEIVVAMDERRASFPVDELLDCKLNGIEIRDLLDFFEREAGKVKLDLLTPSWLIYSDGFRGGRLIEYAQRAFDIAVSLVLLTVTWPIMLLTALAILIECRGRPCPIFYRQERIGLGGRPYNVLKFRSMRTDAESAGVAQWATQNDSRVTKVGSMIRQVRIDELPQIFNVLRGEMSFVGPRPERPPFVEELSRKIPYYGERHRVKPGITGWAQLCYPYGSSDRDAMEKLQYDLYYIKNRTMILNLIVLVQTVEVVLFGKGAR
jgi:sugar transferase (PEP-CTERM system associated)